MIIDECEATFEAIFSGTIKPKQRQQVLDQLQMIINDPRCDQRDGLARKLTLLFSLFKVSLNFFELFRLKAIHHIGGFQANAIGVGAIPCGCPPLQQITVHVGATLSGLPLT
ncbi:hypothetical protein PN36_04190 [Candidatus Thiomargarita nelsonii]|uniref:Uncharacterized protein n=1 Tax=Candidatus Thiomargarita nelsonii TaxID=1003181 RepID=A0A4E0QX49_9GAMM|nr:hypothetical protein PN36_04190 [Candidatus Thiomargarita nelsonii]